MKFCLLSTSYPSWHEKDNEFVIGKFVHDMAKYLVKASQEVSVITQYNNRTNAFEIIDGVKIFRFHYFLKNLETLTGGFGIPENIKRIKNKFQIPFYFFFLFFKALRVIVKENVDIINAHWGFPTGFIGLLLKIITGKKLILTVYGTEFFSVLQNNRAILLHFIGHTLRNADIVVGISPETVRAAQKISGREDIHLIPDGIDIEYYKPGPKDAGLLEKYGCLDKKVIFFTGRMVERKGHRFLLESMNYVRDSISNAKLLLGGNGILFKMLFDLRTELNLEEFVTMPGIFEEKELVPLLQSVDVYVLPSCIDSTGDTEGSATAALEAMACGTPAIVSRVGGNIGSIIDGIGAYYCVSKDPRDIAVKIIQTLQDPALMDKTSNGSRNFIVENYSWTSTIGKYMNLIQNKVNNE